MGETYITGRHIGGGTYITSDMCAGIHISQGYTSLRQPKTKWWDSMQLENDKFCGNYLSR